MEVGKNGRLYGVKNDQLFSINTNDVLQTTNITVYSTGSYYHFSVGLNKQIDGEDYTNFNGTPLLAMNDVEVNGIDAMNTSPSNMITAYNCNDINLTLTSFGTSSYIFLIYNHTDVNGNFTPNGTVVYSSGYIVGNIPMNQNLKSLPGTNGDYLQHNNGYLRFVAISHNH